MAVHILIQVAQGQVYSGTHKYLEKIAPRNGVEVTWLEEGTVDNFEKAIQPNTKVRKKNNANQRRGRSCMRKKQGLGTTKTRQRMTTMASVVTTQIFVSLIHSQHSKTVILLCCRLMDQVVLFSFISETNKRPVKTFHF